MYFDLCYMRGCWNFYFMSTHWNFYEYTLIRHVQVEMGSAEVYMQTQF